MVAVNKDLFIKLEDKSSGGVHQGSQITFRTCIQQMRCLEKNAYKPDAMHTDSKKNFKEEFCIYLVKILPHACCRNSVQALTPDTFMLQVMVGKLRRFDCGQWYTLKCR